MDQESDDSGVPQTDVPSATEFKPQQHAKEVEPADQRETEDTIQKLGLEEDLTATRAFRQLCLAGCAPRALANLVLLWAPEHLWLTVPETGHEIHLRPLDNWKAALGQFDRRKLGRLRDSLRRQCKHLEDLAQAISELQAQRLFRHMAVDGEFQAESALLDLAQRMGSYADSVLPKMIEACGGIGPKLQPSRNALLARIANYVKACTRRPHYQQISDLLSHFNPISPKNLKVIISRETRSHQRAKRRR